MTPVRFVLVVAFFLATVCLFAAMLTLPANAQQHCGPEKAMLDLMERAFGEFVQATATGNGQNLIITANPIDRKWTALQVTNGVACIVMAGTQFRLHQGT
jgi:hypothetical protein